MIIFLTINNRAVVWVRETIAGSQTADISFDKITMLLQPKNIEVW